MTTKMILIQSLRSGLPRSRDGNGKMVSTLTIAKDALVRIASAVSTMIGDAMPTIIYQDGEYLATYPTVSLASIATGLSEKKIQRMVKSGRAVGRYQAEEYRENRTGMDIENEMIDLCSECPRTIDELSETVNADVSLFVAGMNDLLANGILRLASDGKRFEYVEE